MEEERNKSYTLEKKLKDLTEKISVLESNEKSLKIELDEKDERLLQAETRYKKAESSVAELTEQHITYQETVTSETAKNVAVSLRLTEALARIAALELVEQSVKSLRAENEKLQEMETNLELLNDQINTYKIKEISYKSQIQSDSDRYQDALLQIEELEKRPTQGLGDGSSVLNGLNDMEIVIDEHQGKMKVIITKRRPEGQDGLGPVERIII